MNYKPASQGADVSIPYSQKYSLNSFKVFIVDIGKKVVFILGRRSDVSNFHKIIGLIREIKKDLPMLMRAEVKLNSSRTFKNFAILCLCSKDSKKALT
uniref:Uncharacterized protein n=1 Tax=Glossina austeni TaxID=7395 RepID=A0A1A9VYI0_GLOAU